MDESNCGDIAKGKQIRKHQTSLERITPDTAVFVVSPLDLVIVAYQFSVENKILAAGWVQNSQIVLISDQQAIYWLESEPLLGGCY